MKGNNVEPKSATKISTVSNGFSNSTENEKDSSEKERKRNEFSFRIETKFSHTQRFVVGGFSDSERKKFMVHVD
jgi:hypothetical protein